MLSAVIYLFIVQLCKYAFANDTSEENVDVLIKNLFDNLAVDPYLHDMENFNSEHKGYIDQQVKNFLNVFRSSNRERGKRSLHLQGLEDLIQDGKGVFRLKGIEPVNAIPATFPKDIELFSHNDHWYAATLEASGPNAEATSFNIYSFKNETFQKKFRTKFNGAVDLACFPTQNFTLIAIMRNTTTSNLSEKSFIFQYDYNGTVERMQIIDGSQQPTVAFWEFSGNIYLAQGQFLFDSKNNTKVTTTIYKWAGKHFDIVQQLDVHYVKKITPFKIRSQQYLAIANYQDGNGDTNTYSDIYKFNMTSERFELHQRIRTQACTDIQFFDFRDGNQFYEGFLVTANFFNGTDGRKAYLADSIIYKLIDEHFIPFQSIKLSGVEHWLPVQGPGGKFALVASCKFDGIKVYQYDGWSFVESGVELTSQIFKGVNNVAFQTIDDTTTLVISNSNNDGRKGNRFKLIFTHRNELSQFQTDMLKWCADTSKRLDRLEVLAKNISHLHDTKLAPHLVPQEMKKHPSALKARQSAPQFSGVNTLLLDPTKDRRMRSMLEVLAQYSVLLESIEKTIQKPLVSEDSLMIERDLSADNVIVNGDAFLTSLHTNRMNDFEVNDLMDNVIDINNDGFQIGGTVDLEFTRITDDQTEPKFLNGHPVEDIVHNANMNVVELVIRGNATVENVLLVEGKVNDITIDKKSVLLKRENQDFGEAGIKNVRIDNLEVKNINNFEMKAGMCKKIELLKTTHLFVDGLINGIHFPTLNKDVLRVAGDQSITGTYTFDNLDVSNVNAQLLNEQYKPSDLVDTTKPTNWRIDGNLNFQNLLSVGHLTVKSRLDNIKVINRKLDILRKESKEVQHVTGVKQFDNLTLLNPVLLNGPIHGPEISKLNPVTSIDKDIEIVKDITIDGDVTIEDLLQVDDILTENDTHSMKKLLQSGLRLDEKHIPITLNFSQQMNVAEIMADRINGVDVDTWVKNGGDTQIIEGLKVFGGDLSVNGPTSVSRINDINVKDLERNILRTDGDQIISGKHTVKHIVANRITANTTHHAGQELSKLVRNDDHAFSPTNIVTMQNLKAKHCSCRNMTVAGLVNGRDFTKMVEDTLTRDKVEANIEGNKSFKKLRCRQVETKNLDPEQILVSNSIDLAKEELSIDSSLLLEEPINIENINFTGTFNGKRVDEFGKMGSGEEFVLRGNHSLKKLVVIGDTFIKSGHINHVRINSLVDDTMKIDEPLEFDSLKIAGTITVPKIVLNGQIEGLDLDNAVIPRSKEVQVISGEKTFLNDLIVRGNVVFDGKINNMEQSKFFSSVSPNPEKDKVLVKGNVVFPKGPKVEVLNGRPVDDLSNKVWFKDRKTVFTQKIKFEDVEFKANITAKGLFGTLNLTSFEKQYLSKSQNQTVHGTMEFDEVAFNNVSTPLVDLHGRLNGIKLGEFTQTILLHDVDQTFEDTVFIEHCEAKDVKGEYTVNGLDLKKDVMRYDVKNIVTGKKNISYVEVHNLQLDRDIKIQNVTIIDAMERAVLKNSPTNLIGDKTFTNSVKFSGGVSIHGTLNGKRFDSTGILLKDVPQNITGKKTFTTTRLDPIEFKYVKLKGQLNGLTLRDITSVQANKDEDNVFRSTINFSSNISTQNLNIMKLYQGVNVTELLSNVTTLEMLNGHEKIYSALLSKSQKLYASLQDQAFYLHYYKVVGNFENVDVTPVTYQNQIDALITLRNDSNAAVVEFYEWDETNNMYAVTNNTLKLDYYPTYITKLRMYDEDCLYMEYTADKAKKEQQGFPYTGAMISINENRNFDTYTRIPSNGTNYLSTVILPGYRENCLVYTYVTDNFVHIMCDDKNKKFTTYQSFLSQGVSQIVTVSANEIPHIISINRANELHQTGNTVNVRKFRLKSRLFQPAYTIHESFPVFLDAINYNGVAYLAIASGYPEKSIHAGAIHIRRYNQLSENFEPWQVLSLEAPVQVKFAILPSDELVLYATTRNPSRPLVVYMYEGISRFVQKMVASAIEKAEFVRYTTNRANQHFIMTGSGKEVNVIQAVFKGRKWNFK